MRLFSPSRVLLALCCAVFLLAGADAALVAGILHDGTTTVGALKEYLAQAGIDIRQETMEMPRP